MLYNNNMKEYFSHFSAANKWDMSYIEAVLGFKIAETDSVDITVSVKNAKFRNNGKRVRLCTLALPDGTVIT